MLILSNLISFDFKDFMNKNTSTENDSKITPVGNTKPEKKYYDPVLMGALSLPQKILGKVFSSGFKSVTKK